MGRSTNEPAGSKPYLRGKRALNIKIWRRLKQLRFIHEELAEEYGLDFEETDKPLLDAEDFWEADRKTCTFNLDDNPFFCIILYFVTLVYDDNTFDTLPGDTVILPETVFKLRVR